MAKIVIIGNSIAGIKAAEELSLSDISSEITVISNDGYYPCDKSMFPELISGDIKPEAIFYKPKDFYDKNNIKLILDKNISRLNLSKKKIFFEDKSNIDFDILIISESVSNKFSDIKGTHRLGLYGMRRLKDIEKILEDMPFFDSVVIQSDTFSGIRMANAFLKKDKDVTLIASGKDEFFSSIDSEFMHRIKENISEDRFSIIEDNGIKEILGDKDVKAVRLSSEKVLACEVVIIGEVADDLKIFQKQQIGIKAGICVDNLYKTNIDHIYCVDNVASPAESEIRKEDLISRNILEMQGHIVAQGILGNNLEGLKDNDINVKRISIKDISFVFIGDTHRSDGVSEITKIGDKGIEYESVFVNQGVVAGAILINKDDQFEYLLDIIKNKTNINSIEIDNNSSSFNPAQLKDEDNIEFEQDKTENTVDIINKI